MKKIGTFLCIVAVILIAGMLFGACGAKPEAAPTETEAVIGTEQTEATVPPAPTKPTPAVSTESTEATEPSAQMGVGERGDYSDDTTPEATQPAETQPAETQPGTVTVPDTFDPENTTMEMWNAMTDQEQEAFQSSFPTLLDFIHWYNDAKAKEPTKETISSDDNKVDLGELIKP